MLRFLTALLFGLVFLRPPAHAQPTGTLGTLTVGPYQSSAQGVLTGTYQPGAKLATTQHYTNASSALQDSLAFTAQVLGNGYAQSLQGFFSRLQGLGPGGDRTYALGDIELPGPGSYLVQVSAFTYERTTQKWVSGPVRIYWLFPLATPLPVGLVSFRAAAAADSITLAWETASETNCAGFEVQRSLSGVTWYPRGYVAGHGTTSAAHHYRYSEGQSPLRMYYRLRQLDHDGTESFSPVVVLAPTPLAAAQATVHPNPAHDQAQLSAPAGVLVRFYDANGRLRRQQTLDATGTLELTGLPAGTYQLLVSEAGQPHPRRTRLVVL